MRDWTLTHICTLLDTSSLVLVYLAFIISKIILKHLFKDVGKTVTTVGLPIIYLIECWVLVV